MIMVKGQYGETEWIPAAVIVFFMGDKVVWIHDYEDGRISVECT